MAEVLILGPDPDLHGLSQKVTDWLQFKLRCFELGVQFKQAKIQLLALRHQFKFFVLLIFYSLSSPIHCYYYLLDYYSEHLMDLSPDLG